MDYLKMWHLNGTYKLAMLVLCPDPGSLWPCLCASLPASVFFGFFDFCKLIGFRFVPPLAQSFANDGWRKNQDKL